MVFGWVFASHQIGAAIASVAAGVARDRTGTYTVAWFSAALLCVVAAVISLRVQAVRRPPLPDLGVSGGAPGGTRTHTARFLRPLPLPLGYGGPGRRHPSTASAAARASTASSIGSVSRPVKVFCCEGW